MSRRVCTAPAYWITSRDEERGSVANTATVTAQVPATATAPARTVSSPPSTATTRLDPRPALRVTKTTRTRLVRAGSTVAWSITVRNTGTASARDVRTCDVLPSGMTVVDARRGRLVAGRLCFPTMRTLPPGGRRTFRVLTRVDADHRSGRMTNRVVASARGGVQAARAARAIRVRARPAPKVSAQVVTG